MSIQKGKWILMVDDCGKESICHSEDCFFPVFGQCRWCGFYFCSRCLLTLSCRTKGKHDNLFIRDRLLIREAIYP